MNQMILYWANLVAPAAVGHSTDKLDGHFLCTAVDVSLPQEAHALWVSVSPAGRGSGGAGFRQGCLRLLHFCHAGWPHAFVPGDGWGEGVCVCLCVCGGKSADSVPHSSRELPSALSSPRIPNCKCPRLELDPWTSFSLPLDTHIHTHS